MISERKAREWRKSALKAKESAKILAQTPDEPVFTLTEMNVLFDRILILTQEVMDYHLKRK